MIIFCNLQTILCVHVGDGVNVRLPSTAPSTVRQCRGLERWLAVLKIYWTAWTRQRTKLWRTRTTWAEQSEVVQGLKVSMYKNGRRPLVRLLLFPRLLTLRLVKLVRRQLCRHPLIREYRFVAVWFSLTKTKMVKNEKITNSLMKTKTKTKKCWKLKRN